MIGRLGNGVPYAVLHRPGAEVTTVSVWILSGSRHETVPGVAHLLEHVVMQAVPAGRRMRVVDEIEAWGGDANAVTARDHMALYARVPTPDALAALDVLVAAATTAVFDDETVDSERRVVVEELRLAAADPTDIVHDVFFTAAFGDHPMGRPVGGAADGVAALGAADLADWSRAHVRSGLVGVVASGGVDPAAFASAVAGGALAGLTGSDRPDDESPPVVAGRRDHPLQSDTAAVALGGAGFALADPRYAAAEVVVELLAGGNASVLNEEIRSRRGLSYDVSGGASGYRDSGVWRVAISTAPEHREEVAELSAKLVRAAVDRGFSEREFEVARRRVAGLMRLDAESSLSDVMLYGNHGLVAGVPDWTLAHQLDTLARLDADAVNRCAREMVDQLVVATVGNDLSDGGDA